MGATVGLWVGLNVNPGWVGPTDVGAELCVGAFDGVIVGSTVGTVVGAAVGVEVGGRVQALQCAGHTIRSVAVQPISATTRPHDGGSGPENKHVGVGAPVGDVLGGSVGLGVGPSDAGATVAGVAVGRPLGVNVVGNSDGICVGTIVGSVDGATLGGVDGTMVVWMH